MKEKNKNLKNQRKECKIKAKGEKGITLIALVVTIIVLLILAGITINLLFSDNGIIKKAQEAADAANKAVQNDIDTLKDLDDLIKKETGETPDDGIYSEPGVKEKIAPAELFDWEPISTTTGKIATNSEVTLPTKEARIKRIKLQYCNIGGYYNPETEESFANTNYEIIYNGEKISDTLVIPYQLEKDGEFYKVTEVSLKVFSRDTVYSLPVVENIIFPNTVKKIEIGNRDQTDGEAANQECCLKKVVLPNVLESIPINAFNNCTLLNNITIPPSVTSIGDGAFYGCEELSNITIPSSVTSIGKNAFRRCSKLDNVTIQPGVTSIGESAFEGCEELKNISIPSTVKDIANYTFFNCSALTDITIPESVTSLKNYTFYNCSSLTNINIKKPEGSITGAPWGAGSTVKINWNYTGE